MGQGQSRVFRAYGGEGRSSGGPIVDPGAEVRSSEKVAPHLPLAKAPHGHVHRYNDTRIDDDATARIFDEQPPPPATLQNGGYFYQPSMTVLADKGISAKARRGTDFAAQGPSEAPVPLLYARSAAPAGGGRIFVVKGSRAARVMRARRRVPASESTRADTGAPSAAGDASEGISRIAPLKPMPTAASGRRKGGKKQKSKGGGHDNGDDDGGVGKNDARETDAAAAAATADADADASAAAPEVEPEVRVESKGDEVAAAGVDEKKDEAAVVADGKGKDEGEDPPPPAAGDSPGEKPSEAILAAGGGAASPVVAPRERDAGASDGERAEAEEAPGGDAAPNVASAEEIAAATEDPPVDNYEALEVYTARLLSLYGKRPTVTLFVKVNPTRKQWKRLIKRWTNAWEKEHGAVPSSKDKKTIKPYYAREKELKAIEEAGEPKDDVLANKGGDAPQTAEAKTSDEPAGGTQDAKIAEDDAEAQKKKKAQEQEEEEEEAKKKKAQEEEEAAAKEKKAKEEEEEEEAKKRKAQEEEEAAAKKRKAQVEEEAAAKEKKAQEEEEAAAKEKKAKETKAKEEKESEKVASPGIDVAKDPLPKEGAELEVFSRALLDAHAADPANEAISSRIAPTRKALKVAIRGFENAYSEAHGGEKPPKAEKLKIKSWFHAEKALKAAETAVPAAGDKGKAGKEGKEGKEGKSEGAAADDGIDKGKGAAEAEPAVTATPAPAPAPAAAAVSGTDGSAAAVDYTSMAPAELAGAKIPKDDVPALERFTEAVLAAAEADASNDALKKKCAATRKVWKQTIRKWENDYAEAHGGEKPPKAEKLKIKKHFTLEKRLKALEQ